MLAADKLLLSGEYVGKGTVAGRTSFEVPAVGDVKCIFSSFDWKGVGEGV